MSSNIKDINDFVKKSAEKKKSEEEKKRLYSKNDILEKAVKKRISMDAEIRKSGTTKLVFAFKVSAVAAFLIICSYLSINYMDFYRSQTKDMQLYYSKKPDVIGRLSMAMESNLRSESTSLIRENTDVSHRTKILEILGKLAKSEFELCGVNKIANPGKIDESLFEVNCLTRDEKIVFKVSYKSDNCKILDADSTHHRVPIDL